MNIDAPLKNHLLKQLSPKHIKSVYETAEFVHMDINDNVIEPNKPIKFVDFPETGVTSLVAVMSQRSTIEIATVGNEGFIGTSILLGVDIVPEWAFCQVSGASWRLPVADFQRLRIDSPEFNLLCQRFAVTLFNQVCRNLGCNSLHSINKRCARWLLTTHDRVDGDQFYLTQEFLAVMLGVTRSGVNAAAGELQKAGLITYVRGKITILDRVGLERACCDCYRAIMQYYEQIFGVLYAKST
jgi:CRP-like cAMP-binding protein